MGIGPANDPENECSSIFNLSIHSKRMVNVWEKKLFCVFWFGSHAAMPGYYHVVVPIILWYTTPLTSSFHYCALSPWSHRAVFWFKCKNDSSFSAIEVLCNAMITKSGEYCLFLWQSSRSLKKYILANWKIRSNFDRELQPSTPGVT